MLSRDDATAMVAGSRLFDEQWYAEVSGHSFGSRDAAVAAWVAAPDEDSPHPFFEPLWLYPCGAWRRHAPYPLSYYLSRAADGDRPPRSPHPLYDLAASGPLEDWLVDHDPAELLREPVPRDLDGAVAFVEVPADDVRRAVRWVRHLHRLSPDIGVTLQPSRRAARRVLTAVAAGLPRVLIGDWTMTSGAPVVSVDPGIEPPRWAWLPPLLAALERPGVAAAQPVLLDDAFLITAPVLAGHPVSAVERLDGVAVPGRFPGAEARLPGVVGDTVLATGSWIVGAADPSAAPGWDALDDTARRVEVVEGTPPLRWSIDIAAGAAPIGRRWGDWHFARSLADALERRGQWVEIDHPETRGRASRSENDVVLCLRGLARVAPPADAISLLWVISHPEDVTPAELADCDAAFAASTTWAARHGVTPLLQCTDTTRFHPGVASALVAGAGAGVAGHEVLFVGNARGGMRPVVAAAREAEVGVSVIGTGWAEHGVPVVADRIANQDLPAAYASAGVVLNDHWADMRDEGFVSNRVFDVLAVGGRLLTDPVAGLDGVLADVAGGGLPTWQTPADLAHLIRPPYDAWPDAAARLALAERVVVEHSFDARAATLLDAALRLTP
ncbi:hypothetical protein BH09ACT12_BH09ACT12_22270 [soil metagenome]